MRSGSVGAVPDRRCWGFSSCFVFLSSVFPRMLKCYSDWMASWRQPSADLNLVSKKKTITECVLLPWHSQSLTDELGFVDLRS